MGLWGWEGKPTEEMLIKDRRITKLKNQKFIISVHSTAYSY